MTFLPTGEHISEWASLRMSGPDAESFLQGQLTQDLNTLGSEPRWSLVLAPDSVIDAIVTIERDGSDVLIKAEAALIGEVQTRLRRFMLRTQCALDPEGPASSPFATELDRVQHRWPGAGEVGARVTPHTLGRRVIDETISFTKGCFTGQELVGRLDARGANVPWRLYYFSGGDVATVDEWVRSIGPNGPQGVTSHAVGPRGVEGLAVGHRTLSASSPPDAVECTEVD